MIELTDADKAILAEALREYIVTKRKEEYRNVDPVFAGAAANRAAELYKRLLWQEEPRTKEVPND